MPTYSSSYFRSLKSRSRSSAELIVPLILDLVPAQSAVDVGCGTGVWLDEFRKKGVTDIVGVDGDWIDSSLLEIPQACFVVADLEHPLKIDRSFDLVLSLEVAEHLSKESAATFVTSLTSLGNVVVFSAAAPLQGGEGHVNEQWPSYWAKLFAQHAYVPIDCLRSQIWSNPDVEWWYAQNILLFVARDSLADNPTLVRRFECANEGLAIVHPEMYLTTINRMRTDNLSLKKLLMALPRCMTRAVSGRLRRVVRFGGQ